MTVHNTFVLERSYPKPPEKVFAAFADAAKKRRWFGEGDHHVLEEFTLDFRVYGQEKAVYRFHAGTPMAGVVFTNRGIFLDIVDNERIVTASTMELGDMRISASLATFEFVREKNGTKLVFTHQAAFFEGADGPEMRQMGWKKLLDKLAEEVES